MIPTDPTTAEPAPETSGAVPAKQDSPIPQRSAPIAEPPVRRVLSTDLPADALSRRLAQQQRSTLRELGGESIDDVKKRLAEADEKARRLAEYEAKDEENKRAQMSELDRIKADRDAAIARADAAERARADAAQALADRERDEVVGVAALRHVDPEMLVYAKDDLRRHILALQKTDPRKVRAWSDADTDAFFKDLVKKKPRLAPVAAAQGEADARPPIARAAVSSARQPAPVVSRRGAAPPIRRPAPAPAGNGQSANGKTLRPGLPNSMTPAEVKDELRRRGLKSW